MWLNCVHCAFVLCALFNVNQYNMMEMRHRPTHTHQYIYIRLQHTTNTLFPRQITFSFALSRTFQSQKYYAMHSLDQHCIVSNSALGHLSFTTRATHTPFTWAAAAATAPVAAHTKRTPSSHHTVISLWLLDIALHARSFSSRFFPSHSHPRSLSSSLPLSSSLVL